MSARFVPRTKTLWPRLDSRAAVPKLPRPLETIKTIIIFVIVWTIALINLPIITQSNGFDNSSVIFFSLKPSFNIVSVFSLEISESEITFICCLWCMYVIIINNNATKIIISMILNTKYNFDIAENTTSKIYQYWYERSEMTDKSRPL